MFQTLLRGSVLSLFLNQALSSYSYYDNDNDYDYGYNYGEIEEYNGDYDYNDYGKDYYYNAYNNDEYTQDNQDVSDDIIEELLNEYVSQDSGKPKGGEKPKPKVGHLSETDKEKVLKLAKLKWKDAEDYFKITKREFVAATKNKAGLENTLAAAKQVSQKEPNKEKELQTEVDTSKKGFETSKTKVNDVSKQLREARKRYFDLKKEYQESIQDVRKKRETYYESNMRLRKAKAAAAKTAATLHRLQAKFDNAERREQVWAKHNKQAKDEMDQRRAEYEKVAKKIGHPINKDNTIKH